MFDFSDAVGSYAQGEAGARGAIFTRREVVGFILDLRRGSFCVCQIRS